MVDSMECVFRDLSLSDKTGQLIDQVSGKVRSGQILAVIGHELSGKTTLLSCLSGRVPLTAGEIAIRGQTIPSRDLHNYLGLVTSQDLFLPTLTVYETLHYAGLLRLCTSTSRDNKSHLILETEKLLCLHDVRDSPTQFTTGLTRRSLSIACEILGDTDVLCIDEPFKGLSLNDSYKLSETLAAVAKTTGKGLVISMETTDGHLLQPCSIIICLYQGQMTYMGEMEQLGRALAAVGLGIPRSYSPIDFLMVLLSRECNHRDKQEAIRSLLRNKWSLPGSDLDMWPQENGQNGTGTHTIRETALLGDSKPDERKLNIESDQLIQTKYGSKAGNQRPSFWRQFSILTSRNFHNSRRRILFPISVLQNLYILVLCVLVWWRPERTEETIKDRMGLFFFTTVQWAFFALLDAILTFPKELLVIQKERGYRLYGMLAFCVSKTVTEVPLAVIQPATFMTVIYWVANLNSLPAFFGSLGVLCADVIAAQSIGLLVGTLLTPPWTVMVVSLGLLSMMLLGGAFATPPHWLLWGKYASYFTYGLNGFITLEFGDAEPIRCGEKSMVPMCQQFDSLTNTTVSHFPAEAVLFAQGLTWSVLDNVMILFSITIATRVLWYLALRIKNK